MVRNRCGGDESAIHNILIRLYQGRRLDGEASATYNRDLSATSRARRP
jgi:hypothetical protein